MSFQPGATVYTQAFGSRPENVEVPHIEARSPSSYDSNYPIGKKWVDTAGNATYELTSLVTSNGVTTANWQASSGGSLLVSSLTGDTGTATPSAGNIKIAGTASEITTAASGSTVTLSLPSAITTPGSLTTTTTLAAGTTVGAGTSVSAGTTVTATLGAITASNGNLVLGTAGNKLSIATGSNASLGTSAALSSGTVTVNTTAVTAASKIFLSRAAAVGTLGNLSVGTISAAMSFTITSDDSSDSSTVNWLIIN